MSVLNTSGVLTHSVYFLQTGHSTAQTKIVLSIPTASGELTIHHWKRFSACRLIIIRANP